MANPLVSDELCEIVEPLLPPEPPKPNGGLPRVSDHAALTRIIFVLKTGIPWEMLPQEMGCGSGMTCWRRLQDWHEAGVWERLHRVLLDRLGEANQIDWERARLDTASIPAKKGLRDRPSSDESRQDPEGTPNEAPCCNGSTRCPLVVQITSANRHGSTVFADLLDAIPPVRVDARACVR